MVRRVGLQSWGPFNFWYIHACGEKTFHYKSLFGQCIKKEFRIKYKLNTAALTGLNKHSNYCHDKLHTERIGSSLWFSSSTALPLHRALFTDNIISWKCSNGIFFLYFQTSRDIHSARKLSGLSGRQLIVSGILLLEENSSRAGRLTFPSSQPFQRLG